MTASGSSIKHKADEKTTDNSVSNAPQPAQSMPGQSDAVQAPLNPPVLQPFPQQYQAQQAQGVDNVGAAGNSIDNAGNTKTANANQGQFNEQLFRAFQGPTDGRHSSTSTINGLEATSQPQSPTEQHRDSVANPQDATYGYGMLPNFGYPHHMLPPNAKVAIPPQHRLSIDESDAGKHVEQSGPMTKSFTLPNKKKPGRKPMTADNTDNGNRRREQNRNAQRSYRERRRMTFAQTTEELTWARKAFGVQHSQLVNDYSTIEQLKMEKATAQAQADAYKNTIADMEDQIARLQATINGQTASTATPNNIPAATVPQKRQFQTNDSYEHPKPVAPLTPPEQNNMNETDFTNFGRIVPRSTNTNEFGAPASSGPAFTGLGDDNCGFCTDPQNCLCKQEANAVEPAPQPGNCEACMADPQRAKACRQLAASAGLKSAPSSPGTHLFGPPTSSFESMSRHDSHSGRISCEQLMDRAKSSGQRLASIAELFGDQIHAHPSTNGRYEVEEHEAAQALQTLATRNTRMKKR